MPVICITGPRQSGKTTLVKYLFSNYTYYNLEFPEHRHYAEHDARSFLSDFENGIIIDEIQRVPELLSHIQYFVDEKKENGKIVITGSQNILLMQSVSQTLAGRVALFTLLPFSISELQNAHIAGNEYESYMIKGFYPRIYDQQLNHGEWLQDYINTYVERDVRQISAVKDLSLFVSFLQLCAGHTGQLINYSTFSNNLGVDLKTVKGWMSILETSYIIFLQHPYYSNFNKRIVKSPKLYFYDTGLACNLLGLKDVTSLQNYYLKGNLFESFVIAEIHKYIFNNKILCKSYFFRDSNGNEVDVILEHDGQLKAIEIKSSKTIIPDFFKGLQYWEKLPKNMFSSNFLIYGGSLNQARSSTTVLDWKSMNRIFK